MESQTIITLAAVLGFVVASIAHRKGRNFGLWWLFGTLLGIVALPWALLMPYDEKSTDRQRANAGLKKCPSCAEFVKPDAKVCRYCGHSFASA